MQRFWEIILGLDKGFLSKEGEFGLEFNPPWPGESWVGPGVWNFLLIAAAMMLVIYVYRREGRARGVRIALGIMRAMLLLLVIGLLNRPVFTLGQSYTEDSVVAILIDDSISMRVRDGGETSGRQPISRLDAAVQLLTAEDQALIHNLAKQHTLRFYRFNHDAQPLMSISREGREDESDSDATEEERPDLKPASTGEAGGAKSISETLQSLEATGQHTQVAQSVRSVLEDLQSQRLAGVVLLTDGRDTPAQPLAEAFNAIKNYGVKVYPVAIGSDQPPANIDIQSINVEESAFVGDIVNVKIKVRGTGYGPDHPVTLILKDKKTGNPLPAAEGGSAEKRITLADDKPVEAELQFQPREIGSLDLLVEAVKQAGEVDDEDNIRVAQIAILDAKITVLYVDGYPRWEYRYLKNEMIRDKTVEISCLLTSADPTFAQEGDKPIRRFPESIEELMEYDVMILGDVDPQQFSDRQLQLISEFVADKGGGFGMIAGPQSSPQAYRNTAIESILPVTLGSVQADDSIGSITQGFRPVLTAAGESSSIFRFFADRALNDQYIKADLPLIYWYCQGVTVKPGVGEVYAEHPSDSGPDGHKAPILVVGRFGGGRTLFSAIDDSWRWRWYTGESIFNTYWVQQLRYLARSKKLGQRRLTFTSLRPVYDLGEQARLNLRLLDPQLLQQLPEQLRVEIQDQSGRPVRQETLVRQAGQPDLYVASFTADQIGKFTARLDGIAGGLEGIETPIEIRVPRLELAQPRVDRTLLARLASETLGQSVNYSEAREKLPLLIPSAAKVIPIESSQPLWGAPLALVLFVLLITAEWIMRKMFGML